MGVLYTCIHPRGYVVMAMHNKQTNKQGLTLFTSGTKISICLCVCVWGGGGGGQSSTLTYTHIPLGVVFL